MPAPARHQCLHPDPFGRDLGCNGFAGTMPTIDESEHVCHRASPSTATRTLALPLQEIVEPLQDLLFALQKASKAALASLTLQASPFAFVADLSEGDTAAFFFARSCRWHWPATALAGVDTIAHSLTSGTNPLILYDRPPPTFNVISHILLHSTQTEHSNLDANKTIDNRREKAVLLGQEMGSQSSTSTPESSPLLTVSPVATSFATNPPCSFVLREAGLPL